MELKCRSKNQEMSHLRCEYNKDFTAIVSNGHSGPKPQDSDQT